MQYWSGPEFLGSWIEWMDMDIVTILNNIVKTDRNVVNEYQINFSVRDIIGFNYIFDGCLAVKIRNNYLMPLKQHNKVFEVCMEM